MSPTPDGFPPRSLPRRVGDAAWRLALRVAFLALLLRNRLIPLRIRGVYVAVWLGEEILVIRNSYRPGLNFPCGRRNRGEALPDAAVRELFEEVGIATPAEKLTHAGAYPCRYEGATDESEVFVLELDAAPSLRIDHREVVAAHFAPWREVLDDPGLVPIPRAYLHECAAAEERSGDPPGAD